MNALQSFRKKLADGRLCFGTCISFSDPTVVESLCTDCDFVWIDMEHSPLSLETVQLHVMATKGTDTVPIVRVAWNDPVLIKPVLDLGAPAVIVPMVRNAEEARRAVAACRYPLAGVRGYGPRRPSDYGRVGGPDFCRGADEAMFVVIQIEHRDAVENIEEIVKTPGVSSLVLGPNDLSGSMGMIGQPRHPDVLKAIDHVLAVARTAGLSVGIGTGDDPEILSDWARRGVQWLAMGGDCTLIRRGAVTAMQAVRERVAQRDAAR